MGTHVGTSFFGGRFAFILFLILVLLFFGDGIGSIN